MIINIEVTEEQRAAIAANAAENGSSASEEIWLGEFLLSRIEEWKEQSYNRSVAQLGEEARPLPYETRQALVANVRSMIS